ncbi:hypothetical protein Btru_058991 [Bulinus truncatus]|nr:hypothetical protein Btru_058991 [Bulinus truncatus]
MGGGDGGCRASAYNKIFRTIERVGWGGAEEVQFIMKYSEQQKRAVNWFMQVPAQNNNQLLVLSSAGPVPDIRFDPSCADSGFSSSQSLPQNTPSSPAAPQQIVFDESRAGGEYEGAGREGCRAGQVFPFGKSPFAFGPTVIAANVGSGQHYYPSSGNANGGSIPDYQPQQQQQQQQPHHIQQHHHHHQQQLQQQQHGEWTPAPTSLPALGGVGADMRGASPAKDSPGHSNRNSAASSDSGRGYSTGHTDAKVGLDPELILIVNSSGSNKAGHELVL